ncbi:MAG TPA: hypothetical protein VGL82_04420 [Bryobacteraceae bacterium]|jgi:hypothetical protein
MKKLQLTMMLLALVGAVSTAPAALAQPWNQKTILTFSGPVEIPGQVLPGGTYVFKLADSPSNRHIVQVFNEDQNKIFGTFLAIPDYRMKPAEKTIVTFRERPEGQPPALKAWFYPGHNYGHEFVYPKAEAVSLARANDTPVPAVETMPEPRTTTRLQILALNAAPIKAEEPDGKEVEIAEAFGTATAYAESPHAGLPEELPHTASLLPLAGFAGVLLLGAAGALRLAVAGSR